MSLNSDLVRAVMGFDLNPAQGMNSYSESRRHGFQISTGKCSQSFKHNKPLSQEYCDGPLLKKEILEIEKVSYVLLRHNL